MKRKKLWMTSIIVMMIAVIVGVFGIAESVQSQSEGRGEHQNENHEGSRGEEAAAESSESCPAGEGNGEHGSESGREANEGGAPGESGRETNEGGAAGEHGGESGGEASEGGAPDNSEGAAADALTLDESYDVTRNGARLFMRWDAASSSFVGAVENVGDALLTRARVEVHLSNGVELGPTHPTDLAPGEALDIILPAGAQPFATWIPHAEVGMGEGCGESGDPSSPVLTLDESWDGVVNGIRIAMSYDAEIGLFFGTVENATAEMLCAVQMELNLKQGTATVVELGPQPIGDLAPGAQMPVELSLADEPLAVGLAFDAWEIHPEVFDCAAAPTNTERGEGRGEHSNGEGRGG